MNSPSLRFSAFAFLAVLSQASLAPDSAAQEQIRSWSGGPDDWDYGVLLAGLDDVDADGGSDFVVTSFGPFDPSSGVFHHYLDVRSGKTGAVLITLTVGFADVYRAVSRAGDTDLDGIEDFLVSVYSTTLDQVDVLVFSGASFKPLLTIVEPGSGNPFFLNTFGLSLAGGADLNLDQHADFLVGAPGGIGSLTPSFFRVYSGKNGALLFQDVEPNSSALGTAMTILGDVDGDTVPDYAVSAPGLSTDTVRVYSGASHQVIVRIPSGGKRLAAIADQDGDGGGELLVAESSGTRVAVYSSITGGYLGELKAAPSQSGFGLQLADLDDVNGDGVSDFVISATGGEAGPNGGSISLFSGANRDLLYTFDGAVDDNLGWQVAGGDVDGDGLGDVVAGAPAMHVPPGGEVRVYAGNDLYFEVTPDRAAPGATVTAKLAGGVPGSLALLLVLAIDGISTSLRASPILQLDALGSVVLTASVPSLWPSGTTLDLWGIALTPDRELVDSAVFRFAVE